MSESDTDTFTVSFKTSGGYDASLLVARGNTTDELRDNVEALQDLFSLVVETENLLHVAYAAQSQAHAAASGPVAAPTQASSSDSGATVTPLMTCQHGKRNRREGDSKKGHWVGYFCPQPKGQSQCDPVWEDNK